MQTTMKSSVHAILLGAGKLIIENIKALNQMPPVGATLLIMPFKVNGAKARILSDIFRHIEDLGGTSYTEIFI